MYPYYIVQLWACYYLDTPLESSRSTRELHHSWLGLVCRIIFPFRSWADSSATSNLQPTYRANITNTVCIYGVLATNLTTALNMRQVSQFWLSSFFSLVSFRVQSIHLDLTQIKKKLSQPGNILKEGKFEVWTTVSGTRVACRDHDMGRLTHVLLLYFIPFQNVIKGMHSSQQKNWLKWAKICGIWCLSSTKNIIHMTEGSKKTHVRSPQHQSCKVNPISEAFCLCSATEQ